MGATSTMRVSRADALKALANIEMATLSDMALEERLNELLQAGGYSLDEVRIGYDAGDESDVEQLERIVDALAN